MIKQVVSLLLALCCVASATNLATLYARDPIARTYSLTKGEYGYVFQNGNIYNQDSQIDYGTYNLNSITAGIQGNEAGRIVDLGTQDDLSSRYGYSETVGKGQGYASIQFASAASNQLVIRTQASTFQNLVESTDLFTTGADNLVPELDHVLLIRTSDGANTVMVAKVLIVAVDTDLVTFRYDVLRNVSTNNGPPTIETHIKTLYAHDPRMKTMSLSNGEPGYCFCGYTPECDYCAVCNCYSDLDFSNYAFNQFSSGIEGGRQAVLLDIGTQDQILQLYTNASFVFPSIRLTTNTSQILVIGDYSDHFNLRDETTDLFAPPPTSYMSLPVNIGHLYLVRITDTFDATFERIVLFMVLHHKYDTEVTLRYRVLRDTHPEPVRVDAAGNLTFVSTLYGRDPLWRAIDFDTNQAGEVFSTGNGGVGGVYNQNGMLDFDNYFSGGISAGVQGGQMAVLLDLGTESVISSQYSGGFNNAWTELFYNETTRELVFISYSGVSVPLIENPLFFANSTTSGYSSLSVAEEHVYLVRFYDSYDPSFERMIKILVVDYVPNQVLTIRWLWLDKFVTTPAMMSSSSDASLMGACFGFVSLLLVSMLV